MRKAAIVLIAFLAFCSFAAAAGALDRFTYVTSEGDNNLAVIDLNA